MIIKFNNDYLEALYQGEDLKGKPKYNAVIIRKFIKTINNLSVIDNISELRKFNSLNFEALKGDLAGFYSVRVDYHYRLILSLEKEEITIKDIIIIEDLTNHYQ